MLARRRSLFTLCVVAVAACNASSSSTGGGSPDPAHPNDPTTPTSTATSPKTTPKPAPTPTSTTPPVPTPVPYRHFDVNHVLSTGQSNSVANGGNVVLDTTQPYNNIMFSSGVIPATGCGDGEGCTGYDHPSGFVPLVEGDTFFYPVQTMSSPMANAITNAARGTYASKTKDADHVVLVSLHGRSGNTYWCLRKGGCSYQGGKGYVLPFDDGMMEVTDAMALAKSAGKSYVVRAVTAIHGESDHYGYSTGTAEVPLPGTDGVSTLANYSEELLEWQRDYEASVKAITGQTVPVPLLISQMHLWTNVAHSQVVEWQYDAHVKSKGKVVLVTPGYLFPYATDCLHYTSDGQRWIGEYFAKAYSRIVFEGLPWEPVRPRSVTLAGNVVTVKYYVPKPPLVLDTTRVADAGNDGFEFVDAGGANVTISSVAVTAPDTVTVTLAGAPAPGGHLRYAFTAPLPNCPGPMTGVRGNLRDSDPTPSLYGHDLFNWGVTFDEPAQ